MTNEQLNNLVITYQQSKDDLIFSEIYKEVYGRWRHYKKDVFNHLSRYYGLDYYQLEEVGNDVILEGVKTYNEQKGHFYNFLRRILSARCIDYLRSEGKYLNDIPLEVESENEENCSIINFIPCANAEYEVPETFQKKNDQRQLIVNLLGKATDKSRQALIAFSESTSYLDAAKRLGIDNQTVERRIRKISSHFNEDLYGQYIDYFTAPTFNEQVG